MNVDKTQFVTIRSLGNGSYGQVKLLQDKTTQAIYAAKYGKITNQFARATYNELGILKYLKQIHNSPAVELINYFEDNDNIVLLLKKYPHDFKGLQRLKVFDQVYITQIVFVFKSLAVAISTLHELNCVHRDLKSSNVLLDEQGCSHIADFGLAKYNINFSGDEPITNEHSDDIGTFTNQVQTRTICTLIYRSPEQLFAYDDDNKPLCTIYSDEKYFDLFSQGIIYIEILYNQFCIQIKSDCSSNVQAVKYLYAMIYGSDLLEMCKQVYKINGTSAKKFLVSQFNSQLRSKVSDLLEKNPLDLQSLIYAFLTLRFKENLFYTSIQKNIQQFILQFASLLSCIPFRRENPVNCDLFRVENQDIATNLPEEALDNLVQTNSDLCGIDAEIQQQGFTLYNSFTVGGGRFAFQNIVANKIMRVFQGGRQYRSYAEVVAEFKKLRGANTK